MIRNATANDAQAICDIYNPYVLSTAITFETDPVSQEEMKRRIAEVQCNHPWLVWEQEQRVLGYCYATKWREPIRLSSFGGIHYLLPEATGQRIAAILYVASKRLKAVGSVRTRE
jgi:L-amino acid N-acyltransferase YncA